MDTAVQRSTGFPKNIAIAAPSWAGAISCVADGPSWDPRTGSRTTVRISRATTSPGSPTAKKAARQP